LCCNGTTAADDATPVTTSEEPKSLGGRGGGGMAVNQEDGALTSGVTLASTIDEDEACPVCGRSSWIDGWVPSSTRPTRPAGWSWLFVVVGLYLVAACSWRAWQAGASTPSMSEPSSCFLASVVGQDSASCGLARHTADSFARSLVAAAVASVMALLGAVRLARQARRDRIIPATGHRLVAERQSAISRVVRLSTVAETLLVPCFQVLIAITTGYLIAALVRGGSSPGDVLNAALDHTIDLAAFADALLQQ
jgi:hypothetical protein